MGADSVAIAPDRQVAIAIDCLATVKRMKMDMKTYRRRRLKLAVAAFFEGKNVELGRALGHKDGSQVGQMISEHRPISEKTVEQIEALRPGLKGWFSPQAEGVQLVEPESQHRTPSANPVFAKFAVSPTNAVCAPLIEWAKLGDELHRANDTWPKEDQRLIHTTNTSSELCKLVRVGDDAMSPDLLPGDLVLVDPTRNEPERDDVALFVAPDGTFFFARYRPFVGGFEAYDTKGRVQDSARHGISVAAVFVLMQREKI